ncbi:MAG TPA: hypothetical protein VJ771_04645 [Candidatus Nitrosotalea sp.]|nr:hypothetical protein [Candidatus Nitrosotalea sp.]
MKTLGQVTRDIKEFKVQGANQIALYGLSFLKEIAQKDGFGQKFRTASRRLEKARPTAVVLHNCMYMVNNKPRISTIDNLIDTLYTVGKRESAYSYKIIKNDSKIITYCHSGEAMSFIKHAKTTHGKKISVIACKTEPLEQGIITAKELIENKIPVTLIDDNAIGFFIKDINIAITGADALRREGVVNKIGTSLLAQAAHNASKPFYVVANSLKIDSREKFEIEERPTSEIKRKIRKRLERGIKIRNPAFDITPWKYVTGIINENGIFTKKQIAGLL